jgi:hypothetical protein
MEWTADVSAGDWIRERIDDPWRATMHDVVPRGCAAYARIFHPATRSKPVDGDWPPLPYDDNRRAWEAFGAHGVEIDTLPARWADAAAAFGTRLHATAQWGALVKATGGEWNPSGWQQTQAPDGWQFDAPMEGQLDPDAFAAVAAIAAAHTATPDDVHVALWEGWGGLTGGMGYGPSRVFFALSDSSSGEAEPANGRHEDFLAHSARDVFNDVFRKPEWRSGVLSDDISRGLRLSYPARDYVLFRGGMTLLADPDWMLHVPWRDRELEEHGFPPSAHTPSLVWPADRAWVIVTEVDYDSTIVGGTPELISALCADPRLETLPIGEGASLQWDADEVNR